MAICARLRVRSAGGEILTRPPTQLETELHSSLLVFFRGRSDRLMLNRVKGGERGHKEKNERHNHDLLSEALLFTIIHR
jgi:hypothetical protein